MSLIPILALALFLCAGILKAVGKDYGAACGWFGLAALTASQIK